MWHRQILRSRRAHRKRLSDIHVQPIPWPSDMHELSPGKILSDTRTFHLYRLSHRILLSWRHR